MKVLHFEDRGQDCTWWCIDDDGLVVRCGPFQASVWCGQRVRLETVKVGRRPAFISKMSGRELELNYCIRKIDTVTDNDRTVLQHAFSPGLVRSRRGHWLRRDHAGPWYRDSTIERLWKLGLVAGCQTGKPGETLQLTQAGVDFVSAGEGRAA
ncbi:Uncharacterised protein [Starkeya nomas]|uniref:Uncharacterized protein n=1 Tax=Starkeya nomas TaxID=2666134 RepID=A0A5S9NYT5_9HYPH|nr:hypothetical protein [Starkeya nomas]CAA0096019.1 Uncharacterised protein [Starkeya nomas]